MYYANFLWCYIHNTRLICVCECQHEKLFDLCRNRVLNSITNWWHTRNRMRVNRWQFSLMLYLQYKNNMCVWVSMRKVIWFMPQPGVNPITNWWHTCNRVRVNTKSSLICTPPLGVGTNLFVLLLYLYYIKLIVSLSSVKPLSYPSFFFIPWSNI